jgi:hypothetical protein
LINPAKRFFSLSTIMIGFTSDERSGIPYPQDFSQQPHHNPYALAKPATRYRLPLEMPKNVRHSAPATPKSFL